MNSELEKLFNNIQDNNIEFEKRGLVGYDKWKYQERNVIIGENGSGKSRLLNAICEYLRSNNNILKSNIIYMNFSEFGNKKKERIKNDESTSLSTPIVFHHKLPPEAYTNFIPFIKNNAEAFFTKMQGLFSRYQNDSSTIIIQINEYLESTLNRQIRITKKNIEISIRGNNKSYINLNSELKRLSPGERSILFVVLGILALMSTTGNHILFIDEIELHLHPNALIEMFELINNIKPDCFFIATHSIFLIPYFKFEETIYMKDGCIAKMSSHVYQDIYNNIIGNDESKKQKSLYTFLSSIYEWQYDQFLAECFNEPPDCNNASTKDIQFLQLNSFLETKYSKEQLINVLDYGAGSGRIAKCIELSIDEHENKNLRKYLRYNFYDKYKNQDLVNMKNEWIDKSYKNHEELIQSKKDFNVLLLFNVLHEISVDEWCNELNFMLSLLSEEGVIVFGERKVLSQGEAPYGKSGYLVLEKEELFPLFGTSKIVEVKVPKDIKENTVCYYIEKKNCETNIKNTNVCSAIKTLCNNTKDRIFSILDKKTSSIITAREYAFYCQQYVNALHALDFFPNNIIDTGIVNLKGWTFKMILNLSQEQIPKIMGKRSKINDIEGKKCKEWLVKYHNLYLQS